MTVAVATPQFEKTALCDIKTYIPENERQLQAAFYICRGGGRGDDSAIREENLV